MHFIKQRTAFPIENVDELFQSKNETKRHGELLPNTIRCICADSSGSGKTNVLLNLIQSPSGLYFENVYIYSKTLNQNKYKYLESILRPIAGLGFYTFSSNDDIISPSEAKPNFIFIFDDIICDKQNHIKEYFCMGRHNKIDCFYLTQTYTAIPKHLIRDNANMLIIFKQDELNLRHIFQDYSIACDMKFNVFQDMCHNCWSEKFGFLVIDLESEFNKGRYRKGFDIFIHI